MTGSQSKQRDSVLSKAAIRHGLMMDVGDAHLLEGFDVIALKRSNGQFAPFARTKDNPRKSVALARLLCNAFAGEVVDHINGNPWDNRRANLRICSQSANLANAAISKGHSTGFKGVSKNGRRFEAKIRGIYLGKFTDPADAARAYDAAARKMFGGFCAVNFPNPGEQSAHRHSEATHNG